MTLVAIAHADAGKAKARVDSTASGRFNRFPIPTKEGLNNPSNL
ncbi:hypothetical protein [Xanthomonas oryzae]|nr:hypothetical protein [Xanthomonas oryzae]